MALYFGVLVIGNWAPKGEGEFTLAVVWIYVKGFFLFLYLIYVAYILYYERSTH